MNTREKILNEALKLMNRKGLENVSTYDIARSLNIRQSNITYYFSAKSDIINALAKRLIEEVSAQAGNINPEKFSFTVFYSMIDKVMKIHQKYDFIFMNYASIITADKELNNYFINVLKGRQAEFEGLVGLLERNGYLKGTELLQNSASIMLMLNILGIYWVQEAAIYNAGKSDKEKRSHYLKLFFLIFIPFLTSKGKNNLEPLLK